MKKMIALSVLLAGVSGLAQAADSAYIPWTFDDFDANCNVVESATAGVKQEPKVAEVAKPVQTESAVPTQQATASGELGW